MSDESAKSRTGFQLHRITCLVDYDNVKLQPVKSALDEMFNLNDLATEIRRHLGRGEVVTEIWLRLYGGWLDERGMYTPRATWLLSWIRDVRGYEAGIRLYPELVLSLAELPSVRLSGTCRIEKKPRTQKMVDTMMALDACHFARDGSTEVVLVSDDDDLVPASMVASATRSKMAALLWLRLRDPTLTLHYEVLRGLGLNQRRLRENTPESNRHGLQ